MSVATITGELIGEITCKACRMSAFAETGR
jgi:hypothetical protein